MLSSKTPTEVWANFLMNEKLDPTEGRLPELCAALAVDGRPNINMHKNVLNSRRLVCEKAMDLGIDLASIKNRKGLPCRMGRGLLDAWLKAYAERFGSVVGTAAHKEVSRREIKTRMPYSVRSKVE